MKALLYSNQGLSTLHAGIELETIASLRQTGHEVYLVRCDNKLEGCFFNPCHNLLGCAICHARSGKFLQDTNFPKQNQFTLKEFPEIKSIEFPFFNNIDELLKFEHQGINVGRGAASSIISLVRDFEISSHNHHDMIVYMLQNAIKVKFNFEYYIEKIQPDELYFFNGRFAECFPLIGLAQKYEMPYTTMEVSASNQRYELFRNSLPHSIESRRIRAEELWQKADDKEREKIAIEWFEQNRMGTVKTGIIHTQDQQKGDLPEGFDPTKTNIAIFNSSEDEMKVIDEWTHDFYDSQNEVIQKIAENFQGKKDFQFWLRVHPNLGKVDNAQSRGIKELNYKNLHIISPASSVDTYALMDACDKILTFGSTIGIESTYWNKPSILFGKSFYQSLDCVHMPQSFQELYALLEQNNLAPRPRSTTYQYAHYIATYGKPFKHLEYQGKFNSYYSGKKMKRVYPATVLNFFRYLGNLGRWFKHNKTIRGKSLWKSDIWTLR